MFVNLSKRISLICAFLILGSASIFGQNSGKISGTVSDSNGAAIVGANVKALNIGSGRETIAITDGGGKYEFADLPVGSYRISANASGFATNAESVVLGDAPMTQNFRLSPGTIQDVVTVTAGKGTERIASETPQTVTVINSEQLEQQRPRSTFEALERTPNIIVRETNPARERPRLRGLDSSRVLIVIDGEKLNNSRTDLQTGLSPSIIDVTQLESAEVVSGAGSSLYGSDSLAGTINLITKGPTRPNGDELLLGFRFDGNYFSNGKIRRGNGVMNLSNKQFAFRASGLLFRNDNYKIGGSAITLDQVLAAGRFYQTIPTSVPGVATVNSSCTPARTYSCNTANGFPVFSVPAGGEILNGGGHGGNLQFDAWWFPNEQNIFRGRYINSSHKNLGDAFSGPPYETQDRFNPFRKFDKFSLRYERLDFAKWLPRFAVNFYYQKLSFPQAQFDYTNLNTGSYLNQTSPAAPIFTGNVSLFRPSTFTSNKNTVTTSDIDVQATLQPFSGLLVTVGGQILKDRSRDEFISYGFFNFDRNQPNLAAAGCGTNSATRSCGASSPNTNYEDRAMFFQAEFDRIKWFRLTGGLRVDNWRTTAFPSNEFPLGLEFGVLATATPILQANPNPLQSLISSLPALTQLANRTGEVKTDSTTVTGSFGIVGRLPYGINPYFRYGTSSREPSITERYIIRNFNTGVGGFYALVVGNPGLKPETGQNYDVGVKVQSKWYNVTLGYFRNNLKNLVVFQSPDTGNICTLPTNGIPGIAIPTGFLGCPAGRALINFNGRVNQAENVISGWESTGEVSIPMGNLGSINPFYSFGILKGTNKSPTPVQLFIIDTIFNRSDTPIRLKGSRDDVPLGNITPFRLIGGAQFADRSGRLFIEYSFRHQDRVTRVNPTFINGTTLVNYGTYASLNGFTKHAIKGGYTWRTDKYRFSLNAGIDNLSNKLYFEQFQNSPAPGRAFVFGFTTELFNILKW